MSSRLDPEELREVIRIFGAGETQRFLMSVSSSDRPLHVEAGL